MARRYMAEILPIRRETLYNQSINDYMVWIIHSQFLLWLQIVATLMMFEKLWMRIVSQCYLCNLCSTPNLQHRNHQTVLIIEIKFLLQNTNEIKITKLNISKRIAHWDSLSDVTWFHTGECNSKSMNIILFFYPPTLFAEMTKVRELSFFSKQNSLKKLILLY